MSKVIVLQIACLVLLVSGCEKKEESPKASSSPQAVSQAENTGNYVPVSFVNALNYSNQAAQLTLTGNMDKETAAKMVRLYESALLEGQKVDIGILNKIYPDFGTNFKKDYVYGVDLLVQGFKSGNQQTGYEGFSSLTKWNNWYSKNVAAIRKLGSGI